MLTYYLLHPHHISKIPKLSCKKIWRVRPWRGATAGVLVDKVGRCRLTLSNPG